MTEVLYAVAEGVATITLNAPERRNAFTAPMVRELIEACAAADADESVGAVVVRAEGESFCAGAHRDTLAEAGRDPARPDNFRGLGLTYNAFVRVGELLAPSIAAVRGHAVGAGVNLMLATDVRIVAETARVMTGFLRIGIHPGGGHFALLGRLAGREAAAAMSLFGEEVSGRRAAELGLAWAAVPEAEVEDRALELARRAARDPELARAAARSMRLELGPPAVSWPAALELEKAVQMWSLRRKSPE
ncbi:MAG TPA: enoyl-CoA hydratase-related protein [Candidatus Dormibacteraeota bacterium]